MRNERGGLWVLAIGIVWLASGAALAADPKPSELARRLVAVEEAQRALGGEVSQVRDQVRQLQERIEEVRDEMRQGRDAAQGDREQWKGMREEVRGLYVESSGVKGDVAQLGKQVDSLDESLGRFRLSAGIVVALVIVLQVIVMGLVLRRGS